MKGGWRILKAGIRLHGTKAADQVFATCCALHVSRSFRGVEPNYRPHHDHASCLRKILEVDGLDVQWENGVPGIWEGPLGEHDAADVPLIFARVQATGPESDLSGMENGEDDSKIGGAGESEDEGDEDRGASESSTGGTLRAEGVGVVLTVPREVARTAMARGSRFGTLHSRYSGKSPSRISKSGGKENM